MQDQLVQLLEKLQAAKDIAEQSRRMEMVVYLLDMAIVEAPVSISSCASTWRLSKRRRRWTRARRNRKSSRDSFDSYQVAVIKSGAPLAQIVASTVRTGA
ncbi:hypothetical protein HB774_02555 [Rhizobium leguminosarum bv. viciae]|nr:hypothetical protein HB774_02555 [Rhizobium leguminosarum bv. viciae]